jgi:hypothetical protein
MQQPLKSAAILHWNIKYNEQYYLLGYDAVYSVEFQPTFRSNISTSSSGSKYTPRKIPACSSETSVVFQQTTWHYIPEDSILHNHRCENLKSYINYVFP